MAHLCGKMVKVKGRDNPLLVVGFQRRLHKIYCFRDQITDVLDLITEIPWQTDESIVLNYPVGERIVVMWDGSYDAAELVTNKLPYEAYIVQHRKGTVFRLLYTADDTLEDRDLANAESWDLVPHGLRDFNKLPIVSWSEIPEVVIPVVERKH